MTTRLSFLCQLPISSVLSEVSSSSSSAPAVAHNAYSGVVDIVVVVVNTGRLLEPLSKFHIS